MRLVGLPRRSLVFLTILYPWPRTKGGGSSSQGATKRKAKRPAPKREEIVLTDLSKIIEEGEVVVGDVVVKVEGVPQKPVAPVDPKAPDINSIVDEMEREITELLRTQAQIQYAELVQDYQEEVRTFEEELLVFLILITE